MIEAIGIVGWAIVGAAVVSAIGSIALAYSSLSVRAMQSEKRREEKHEIGDLTRKELYLLGNSAAGGWVRDGDKYDIADLLKEDSSFATRRFRVSVSEFGASMRRLLVYGLLKVTEGGRIVISEHGETYLNQLDRFIEEHPEARGTHFWNRVAPRPPWWKRVWNTIQHKKEEIVMDATMYWPCASCGRVDRERPYRRDRDPFDRERKRYVICNVCASGMKEEDLIPKDDDKTA